MKLVILTEINNQALKLAIALVEKDTNVRIMLLSDAVYLINNLDKKSENVIYVLAEDLVKRIDSCPAGITSLTYQEFIDLIMDETVTIINL